MTRLSSAIVGLALAGVVLAAWLIGASLAGNGETCAPTPRRPSLIDVCVQHCPPDVRPIIERIYGKISRHDREWLLGLWRPRQRDPNYYLFLIVEVLDDQPSRVALSSYILWAGETGETGGCMGELMEVLDVDKGSSVRDSVSRLAEEREIHESVGDRDCFVLLVARNGLGAVSAALNLRYDGVSANVECARGEWQGAWSLLDSILNARHSWR